MQVDKEEGLLQELHEKICIGQGYRGKSGALGVGSCTSGFACNLKGCPPTDEQMYEFLKQYIATRRKTEAEKYEKKIVALEKKVSDVNGLLDKMKQFISTRGLGGVDGRKSRGRL